MEGTCLCGQIKVTIPKGLKVAVCHCIDCRHAFGSTHGAVFEATRGDMKITGKPRYYGKNGNSGKEVRRYFCGTCASPLYTEDDCLIIEGKDGIADDSPTFVKIGLFPVGSIPAPSSYMFARDMEAWEKPVEGAEVKHTS